MSKIQVTTESTPNPQSIKFVFSQPITNTLANFTSVDETEHSPLANKLFGFPWTSGVLIGPDFVTITKQEWVEWTVLKDPLCSLLVDHITRQLPVLLSPPSEESQTNPQGKNAPGDLDLNPNDSPVVQKIKSILAKEIRPAVARDGGDVVFHKYEDQIVYVFMRGACSGCPSSSATLKFGIEARLKEALPEIQEVIAL